MGMRTARRSAPAVPFALSAPIARPAPIPRARAISQVAMKPTRAAVPPDPKTRSCEASFRRARTRAIRGPLPPGPGRRPGPRTPPGVSCRRRAPPPCPRRGPALVDDHDAVAEALDDLHDVAREHHGAAARAIPLEHLLHHLGVDRVERAERLVEHEHPRCVEHGDGEADALGHAEAEVRDHPVGHVVEVDDPQQLVRAAADLRGVHAAEQARVLEHLGRGQAVEQDGIVRHEAQSPLRLGRVRPDGHPVDDSDPLGGLQQAHEHADRGALARAVRPGDPVEGAVRDGEIDAVDRALGAEGPHKAARLDGEVRHGGLRVRRAARRGR